MTHEFWNHILDLFGQTDQVMPDQQPPEIDADPVAIDQGHSQSQHHDDVPFAGTFGCHCGCKAFMNGSGDMCWNCGHNWSMHA